MSKTRVSHLLSYLTRLPSIPRYDAIRDTPRWVRFLLMAVCGLEVVLVGFQLKRMAPSLEAIALHLDDWSAVTQLTSLQGAMLGLVFSYAAGLAFLLWASQAIFRVCRDSLEGDLFR